MLHVPLCDHSTATCLSAGAAFKHKHNARQQAAAAATSASDAARPVNTSKRTVVGPSGRRELYTGADVNVRTMRLRRRQGMQFSSVQSRGLLAADTRRQPAALFFVGRV